MLVFEHVCEHSLYIENKNTKAALEKIKPFYIIS